MEQNRKGSMDISPLPFLPTEGMNVRFMPRTRGRCVDRRRDGGVTPPVPNYNTKTAQKKKGVFYVHTGIYARFWIAFFNYCSFRALQICLVYCKTFCA
mgnify:CR=1 FL=1